MRALPSASLLNHLPDRHAGCSLPLGKRLQLRNHCPHICLRRLRERNKYGDPYPILGNGKLLALAHAFKQVRKIGLGLVGGYLHEISRSFVVL